MSGWDVPSTPSWAPQDGPDETGAFAAAPDDAVGSGSRDFAAQQEGARPGPDSPSTGAGAQAGGPPPEFFGDQATPEPGSGGYPRRVPGQSLQGMPRRDGRAGAFGAGTPERGNGAGPDGQPSRPAAFGASGAFGQAGASGPGRAFGSGAFGRDDPFDRDNGPGQDAGATQDSGFGNSGAFGRSGGFGQGGGFGQDRGPGGGFDAPGRDNDFSPSNGAGPAGGFGRDNRFGPGGGFGRDDGSGQPNGPGPDPGFGRDTRFGQDDPLGRGNATGRDDALARDAGFGGNNGFGRGNDAPDRGVGDRGFREDGSQGRRFQANGSGDNGFGDNGSGDNGFQGRGPRDDGFRDGPRGSGFGPGAGRRDGAPGRDNGFGRDDAFSPDSAYGIGWGGPAQPQRGREYQPEPGADDWAVGGEPGDDWGRGPDGAGGSWDRRAQTDPALRGQAGPGVNGQDFRQPPVNGHEYRRLVPDQDLSQPGGNGRDYEDRGFGADFGDQRVDEQGVSDQRFGGQRLDDQRFDDQGYDGQVTQGRRPAGPQDPGGEFPGAQMDPALQDFFGGERPGRPGHQDPWGASGPATFPARRYRESDDDWAAAAGTGSNRAGTGPQTTRGGGDGPRSPAGAPRRQQGRRGLGSRGIIAIGAVVVVIAAVALYVLLRPGSTNSGTPASSTTAPTQTSSGQASGKAGSAGGSAGGTAAYRLSTPASAGGFPKGSDPNFLAIASSTAGQVSEAVTAGQAGTVKGNPVSAAYTLPAGGQVVTFVGYQGKFTPAKVATVLKSLGSDPHTYQAGPHGGFLGCANAPATATVTSGAVCVWASSSTLGVTEFFSATGPEALTASQNKGATDTVNMRADVEAPAK